MRGSDQRTGELFSYVDLEERVRRTNAVRALQRHDFAYRWETILNAVGLSPSPKLEARKSRLQALAEEAERPEHKIERVASLR